MKDRYFKKVYSKKIIRKLAKRHGSILYHHVNISASTAVMLNLMRKMDRKHPRRGEAVMVMPNLAGRVWLHSKTFYPTGVYRLMSGGMHVDESAEKTLKREALEETGFSVKIARCLAVVTYKFSNGKASYPFVSYVFLTNAVEGIPTSTDPDESIEDFQAVPVEALFDIARQLRQLKGDFADWGNFRAVTHDLAAKALLLDKIG